MSLKETTMSTPSTSGLIPFTDDASDRVHMFLDHIPWGNDMHHTIKCVEMDPVPEINAKGGRTIPANGWRTVFSVDITEGMANPMGNLHGACSATLVDSVSSAAMSLLGTEGFWGPPMLSGVSVTLDMQYLNPAPVGAKVRLTCTVEHMTTSMANIRVDLADWNTSVRFSSGVHVKTWRNMIRKAKL